MVPSGLLPIGIFLILVSIAASNRIDHADEELLEISTSDKCCAFESNKYKLDSTDPKWRKSKAAECHNWEVIFPNHGHVCKQGSGLYSACQPYSFGKKYDSNDPTNPQKGIQAEVEFKTLSENGNCTADTPRCNEYRFDFMKFFKMFTDPDPIIMESLDEECSEIGVIQDQKRQTKFEDGIQVIDESMYKDYTGPLELKKTQHFEHVVLTSGLLEAIRECESTAKCAWQCGVGCIDSEY